MVEAAVGADAGGRVVPVLLGVADAGTVKTFNVQRSTFKVQSSS